MLLQTNSQASPSQGKNQDRKRCHVIPQLMWCLLSHAAQLRAAQAMRTWGRYLQHQQQVPCHLPDQGSSPSEGDATSVPQSYNLWHTRGLSQLLLLLTQSTCKKSCTQCRGSPKPTLLVWTTEATAPWSPPHKGSLAQLQAASGGSRCTKPGPVCT